MEPWRHHLHAVSCGCSFTYTCTVNIYNNIYLYRLTVASLTSVSSWSRLSGLSPFLGDDDNETLNNILACQWNFEVDEFTDISDEAKEFITLLLVKSKSWRMSAAESLRHPWLSDRSLHYRLNQKVNTTIRLNRAVVGRPLMITATFIFPT